MKFEAWVGSEVVVNIREGGALSSNSSGRLMEIGTYGLTFWAEHATAPCFLPWHVVMRVWPRGPVRE